MFHTHACVKHIHFIISASRIGSQASARQAKDLQTKLVRAASDINVSGWTNGHKSRSSRQTRV